MLFADGPAWYAEHIMCWKKDTDAMPSRRTTERQPDPKSTKRNRQPLDHDDRMPIDRCYYLKRAAAIPTDPSAAKGAQRGGSVVLCKRARNLIYSEQTWNRPT